MRLFFFPKKSLQQKGDFTLTLSLSRPTGSFANIPFSPRLSHSALCAALKSSLNCALVFFVKRERIKSKTKMANNTPGRRTTRAQSAGKKTSKTPPTSPPPNTPTTMSTKNTTKRKKKEEKEDLLQVEEIAKRVKRASIETKEEKEGEKTKEKEETNEEEYAYAEINSVLKRLHFEARERRRTSMSP